MKKTLLIVEDDEYQLKQFKALAETYDCTVITAEYGVKALHLMIANQDINIVITDVKMEVGDGLFVVGEISLLERAPIPVLVHSNENTYHNGRQAINLPEFIDFHYKSFARFRKKHPDLRQVREFLDEHCKD